MKKKHLINRHIATTRIVIFLLLISILLSLNVTRAQVYQTTFQSKISISINEYQGGVNGSLIFGCNPQATDSFDTSFDSPSPPGPPEGVYARFVEPTYSPSYMTSLATDIKPDTGNISWTLSVMSVDQTGYLIISWIGTGFNQTVLSGNGSNYDLSVDGQFSLLISAGQSYSFTISFVNPIVSNTTPTSLLDVGAFLTNPVSLIVISLLISSSVTASLTVPKRRFIKVLKCEQDNKEKMIKSLNRIQEIQDAQQEHNKFVNYYMLNIQSKVYLLGRHREELCELAKQSEHYINNIASEKKRTLN